MTTTLSWNTPDASPSLSIDRQELLGNATRRYDDLGQVGPLIARRIASGYFTPDEHYEVLLDRLVTEHTSWLDVGCGRNLLPANPQLSRILAARCAHLVGLDPDETLKQNEFVHEAVQSTIEEYESARQFDLVTFRMVVEHIGDPGATVQALRRLTHLGSRVLIYTVDKWSVSSIAARLIPFAIHHPLKNLLWRTESEDTFPVVYRMNTRARLKRVFSAAGFVEICFQRIADSVLWRFPQASRLELKLWQMLKRLHLPHPDCCLLGVYERDA